MYFLRCSIFSFFLPYSLFSQFAPKNTRPQKHYNNIIFIDFLVKSSQSTSKVIDTFSLRTKYFFLSATIFLVVELALMTLMKRAKTSF